MFVCRCAALPNLQSHRLTLSNEVPSWQFTVMLVEPVTYVTLYKCRAVMVMMAMAQPTCVTRNMHRTDK